MAVRALQGAQEDIQVTVRRSLEKVDRATEEGRQNERDDGTDILLL